jgi:hypothetical protein
MSAADIARKWNTITSIATLGTNRGAPSLQEFWPAMDVAASSESSGASSSATERASLSATALAGPPERSLLRVAAVNYLCQLSGTRVAAADLPAPDLAPALQGRLVSENAAWRLARMLAGDHRDLVPEWFSIAAHVGAVLPPHWLPVVLNELQPNERAGASAVLGARADWLAKRNPEWSELATASGLPIDRWNNGTLFERRAALIAIRAGDPVGGRVLLERSWETEPPEARVAFLETLLNAPGLSEADEPFLESALDDKRKDVRMAAVECLCRLPNSAHARRNIERLQPLVTLTEQGSGLLSKLRKRRLEITLPESLDKAALRDGINSKPPAQQKIGERAYWLMQMIALAPPAHWCERFRCDIETFIAAALSTDYAVDLVLALSHASIRHRDRAWIAALSTQWLTWFDHAELQGVAAQTTATLVAAAPSNERDAILRQLLAASKPPQLDFLQGTLAAADLEWSAETTRLAFERLDQRTQIGESDYTRPRNTLAHWGTRAEAATASRALTRMLERTPDKSAWRNALEALHDIIEFRLAMRQELTT